MSKIKVTLSLDTELVPRVDDAAWLARLSRSAWVEARLEDALAGRGAVTGVAIAPSAGSLTPRPVSAPEIVVEPFEDPA